ncbi:MAG: HAD hydrolase family protein [Candidatus Marinimicrobia bacterium]|jgi:3-deoxy-D-manno-octulosonate 8-phosphate phosphatase (KDO 8-P phosphatase)|nr:HAD hydrolase family protein [Candidatus Neomarinimicrobiota bacterium]MCK9560980.1 HAD hydrolase family protein [Candidatus Neomarinimicrobiota bacterium]MDD5062169.1 HAD hydrolase family protein [Candidatus Neomarinimicrobiota bacterium]MDD5230269.1 HAD hydrolase family protein [Candidatus Neomarinimicrobiota bacterium]MDD5539814.1 HAD hydrolase family protein [Candidatus Neomarinimicrobiota bacterium]
MTANLKERLLKIRLLIADVDGVFTNGALYIGADGLEFKRFHVRDGAGISLLKAVNFPVAVISGRNSAATKARMKELGLEDVLYQGHLAKLEPYEEIKKRFNLDDEEIIYIGDDVIDVPLLKRVGLPVAVANALPEVKQHALYITKLNGGDGAVREVIDLVLEVQQLKKKAAEIITKDTCKGS